MKNYLLPIFLLIPLHAVASEEIDDQVKGFQLTWDNDRFIPNATDHLYTNGIRLAWTYNRKISNPAIQLFSDNADIIQGDSGEKTISYSFGQLLYTPSDIKASQAQPYDRPWGAFLYFGVAAQNDPSSGSEHRSTELKIGVAGPSALGEEVQSAIHTITDSAQPKGWDWQVKSRVGIQVSHVRTYRLNQGKHVGLQLGYGAAIGTIRNYASATATILIGDLDNEQDAPIIIGNEGDFIASDLKNRSQYQKPFFFLSASPTFVAYNYFLEGRTPYGKPDIDPRHFYSTFQYGFSVPLQKWFSDSWPRLVYRHSIRTSEFSSDSPNIDDDKRSHRWGTVELIWNLD